MDFAPQLDHLFAQFGVDVVLTRKGGGPTVTGRAIVNRDGAVGLGGDLLLTNIDLHYQAASFADVARGDVFTIAGIDYAVREAPQVALDGLEWRVPLARA